MQEMDLAGNMQAQVLISKEPEYLGTSMPRDLRSSTTEEHVKSEQLAEALRGYKVFAIELHYFNVEILLQKILQLFNDWIVDRAIKLRMPKLSAKTLNAHIVPYGSFRFRTWQFDEQLYVACLLPALSKKLSVTTYFHELLKKQKGVSFCRHINEEILQIIELRIYDYSFCIEFFRLPRYTVSSNIDIVDPEILRGLPLASALNLSESRITEAIIRLVPNNLTFYMVMMAIKLWAQNSSICEEDMGYFSETTLAIMVARVCQLYPNVAVSVLVQKFFFVFTTWNWTIPVMLRLPDKIDMGLPAWDPYNNQMNNRQPMLVITPIYPHQNSAEKVTKASMRIILREMRKAEKITQQISMGQLSWKNLYEQQTFFHRYNHFLAFLINSDDQRQNNELVEIIEPRFHFLMANLERDNRFSLAHIHPTLFQNSIGNYEMDVIEAFDFTLPYCSMWLVGLELKDPNISEVDLSLNMEPFLHLLKLVAKSKDISLVNASMEYRHITRDKFNEYFDNADKSFLD